MTKHEAFLDLEKCRKRLKMLKSRPYDVSKEMETLKKRFDKSWEIAYGFPFSNVGQQFKKG